MVQAYKKQVEVPQPPVIEPRVLLELTLDEAATLLWVTRFIGGNPEGRRRHIDALRVALSRIDVPVLAHNPPRLASEMREAIDIPVAL